MAGYLDKPKLLIQKMSKLVTGENLKEVRKLAKTLPNVKVSRKSIKVVREK